MAPLSLHRMVDPPMWPNSTFGHMAATTALTAGTPTTGTLLGGASSPGCLAELSGQIPLASEGTFQNPWRGLLEGVIIRPLVRQSSGGVVEKHGF